MIQSPMKGISNPSKDNFSYVHSALQSLSCLECTQQFLNYTNQNNMNNNPTRFFLTKALFDLLNDLTNGKEGNSQNIIKGFIKSYNINSSFIQENNVFSQEPFYFLYFLLQFLHIENNIPKNDQFNLQDYNSQCNLNQQNDEKMFQLFSDFFNQTQNSMISYNFFSIERNTYKCDKCGIYFSYGMKTALRINVDVARNFRDSKNPLKKRTNIDIDDCLNYYIAGFTTECKNCKGQYLDKYSKIVLSANVLIFSLERKQHTFKGDVDFITDINISNYISKTRTAGCNINPNYKLKACISTDNDNSYYADCLVNNIWYRFKDNNVTKLNGERNIYDNEPQILIYELNSKINEESINLNIYGNMNKSNNNYMNGV